MDNAYVERNMLTVRKTRYTGSGASVRDTRRSVVKSDKKTEEVRPAPKTVRECAGVREKYKVSAKTTSVPVSARSVSAPKAAAKNKGFVYVEHSGFAGTFRDAFCTKRVKSSGKSCFDKVVLVLLFAVLMFFVAGSYCEYYETFKEVKEISSQIAECRDEQSKLIVAIEERNNRMNIEEYAVNNLGMVKSDKLTKHYVNISEKDAVNITVTEEKDAVSGGVLLSGFKSVMSNIFGEN